MTFKKSFEISLVVDMAANPGDSFFEMGPYRIDLQPTTEEADFAFRRMMEKYGNDKFTILVREITMVNLVRILSNEYDCDVAELIVQHKAIQKLTQK